MVNFPFYLPSEGCITLRIRRRVKMNWRKRCVLWSSIVVSVLTVVMLIVNPAQTWACDDHNTVVKTDYGKLRGYVNEDKDVLVWKGVPYARPPMGELRWAAPLDPEPWHGVRDATSPANKCTQLDTLEEWINTGKVDPNSSEDCLYVDIYRPKHHANQWERLPVYVWIHGGSNYFGSAWQYDGTALATRSDVVVVVVQYRLGPMGWFYHPAVQTGGADKYTDSGNFGTLDHAQALKWVRKNIDAFGGDPHNVTITGESAGGHNVMNMVVSPLGKGLFRRAMSESGGMYTKPTAYARNLANTTIERVIRYKEEVDAATATQRRIEMENNGTLEAYLRPIDAGTFFLAIIKYGSLVTYDGIEDGTVIPVGGWMPAIKAGKYNKVPIILGSNEYESKAFMPLYGPAVKPLGIPSGLYNWFNLQDVLNGNSKPGGGVFTLDDVLPTPHDKDVYELIGYYGSRNWRAKYVDTVAHELAKVQDDVYAYFFKWGGIGSGPSPYDFIYGACHAAEIPFFFGSDHGLFGFPFVPANEAGRKQLQYVMMEYLANFAWTGNPNHDFSSHPRWGKWPHSPYLPKWKEWSNVPGAPKAIVFDADFHHAHIAMMNEELTIEGVTAALEAAMTSAGLSPYEKIVARNFQFSPPW
jgi:para-nitrobenzyl esterase